MSKLKFFLSKISGWIYFWIWFLLTLWITFLAYASYTWVIQSNVWAGSGLTAQAWNDMINNMNYLKENVETKLATNWNGSALTGLTKTQVGLWSADNTADSTKNVLSATKLTTARTINWVSFNWTANITIPTSISPVSYNTTVLWASNLGYNVDENRNCDLFCRVVKWYLHWYTIRNVRGNNWGSNICWCFN